MLVTTIATAIDRGDEVPETSLGSDRSVPRSKRTRARQAGQRATKQARRMRNPTPALVCSVVAAAASALAIAPPAAFAGPSHPGGIGEHRAAPRPPHGLGGTPRVPTADGVVFQPTALPVTWTVPSGVSSLNVTALGGSGGGGSYGGYAGLGAKISGTLAVTPGERLTILAGSRGQDAGKNCGGSCGGGGWGWHQGGFGGSGNNEIVAAGGGGSTAIETAQGQLVVVAGGGGGAGANGMLGWSGGTGGSGGQTPGDGDNGHGPNGGDGGKGGAATKTNNPGIGDDGIAGGTGEASGGGGGAGVGYGPMAPQFGRSPFSLGIDTSGVAGGGGGLNGSGALGSGGGGGGGGTSTAPGLTDVTWDHGPGKADGSVTITW